MAPPASRRPPSSLLTSAQPFLAGLIQYAQAGVVRFHTPGHRGGRWIEDALGAALGASSLSLDVSDVLEGGKDGPADWTAALVAAQERTAALFGAAGSRYLVNGTSGGIHAALLGLAAGGDILCRRASHLSVYAACVLSRGRVHTVPPDYDGEWDIPGPAPVEAVLAAARAARPRLYVETYPNYYGIAPNLKAIAAGLGESLIVADEAHGSHFRFCPQAPAPALAHGAHVTVQSFHKTLGALTQASALHVHSRHPELLAQIDRALLLLQTTSPSPLLLSSLEAATQQARNTAAEDWAYAAALAEHLREEVVRRVGCRVLSAQWVRQRWNAELDPARVVINVADLGWQGTAAAQWLRARGRIQVEMANERCLVLLVSPGNTEEEARRMVAALEAMKELRPGAQPLEPSAAPPQPAQAMPLWEAALAPCTWVPLEQSAGRIAAEFICPYPPGIPVLLPGEEVDEQVIEYLRRAQGDGKEVRGARFRDLSRIGVVA